MDKALLPDTPEVKNWVRELLYEGGIHLYPVEGYSVKDEGVTALFERRISTVEVEKWSEDEVSRWLETKEDRNSWLARAVLAESLNVPLYLVLWQRRREVFRNLSFILNRANRIEVVDEELFDSCEDFARWMANLKGIPVSKGFVECGRLSLIDKCLRSHGVPWPGNLDGFVLSKTKRTVKAIFEFSRTRKYPVKSHDLNRYFSYDINRWKALDILRKQLGVSLYIVIWSSGERVVKLHKLRDVTESALDYESTELLTSKQLIPRFGRIVG
jgi:hypothetical protein